MRCCRELGAGYPARVSTAIIGGGASGLSLAHLLEDDVVVFEADAQAGGHCRATTREGFTFDRGPHIMFSRNTEILEFMVDSLGGNVHRSKRNNVVCIDGRFARYPIENDLAALSVDQRNSCLLDFLFNEHASLAEDPANLDEWFVGNFGSALTDLYFRPYNEKIWNVPLAELSMSWADRIPNPPKEDVVRGALGITTEGYLHQLYFHYPLEGGYGALTDAWARALPEGVLRLASPVERLERDGDGVRVWSGGGSEHFDRVVSTVPMPLLVSLLGGAPAEVSNAVGRLRVNPVAIVTLGVRGTDERQLTAAYFPDRGFLANRVSFPCTFSPRNGPEGAYSIQAELTYPPGETYKQASDEELVQHMVDGLVRHALLENPSDVMFSDVQRIEHAYVVYTVGYEDHVDVVRSWASQQGVELHGRFGAFSYLNVDGCVAASLEVATRLNGRSTKLAEIDLGARRS